MPTLQKFIGWLRDGHIRNNVGQAAGWLILIGAAEYNTYYTVADGQKTKPTVLEPLGLVVPDSSREWKCGSYEPTGGVHGDIEFLYEIDVEAKTISCFESWDDEGNGKGKPAFVDSAEKPWKSEEAA